MSAAKEARYSLGGARSGSPTKAASRRLSTAADTAATRRPASGDRPEGERDRVVMS